MGKGSDKGKILALFNLLDVGIAQRKGNFRREASADRSTACESDQNNTEIFEIAQGIFCKSADRSVIILLQAFFLIGSDRRFRCCQIPASPDRRDYDGHYFHGFQIVYR